MNRARIYHRRRREAREILDQRDNALALVIQLHHKTLARAKDRIDHHDEKLGITRPIGSWEV